MKRLFVLSTCIVLFFSSCDVFKTERTGRGSLVSITKTLTFTKSEVVANALLPTTSSYGAEVYKVVYNTIDTKGNAAIASGLLVVPTIPAGESPNNRFSMLVESHGTITQDSQAPSVSTGYHRLLLSYAADGFVTLAPDLHGFGSSQVAVHPYIIGKNSADVSIDMMRAVRDWALDSGIRFDGKIMLSGYSQGGYTTMALHKELESNYTTEFPVTASTPMAGPYDVSGVMLNRMIDGTPHPNPFFAADILLAYQDAYGFATGISDFLRAPYATTVPPLFTGRSSSGDQINAALPSSKLTADMLVPAFYTAFQNSTHPLRARLAENNVSNWKPKAPIQMYHCAADDNVPYENSAVTLSRMRALGATNVNLTDPLPTPAGTHGGCAGSALFSAKNWIANQR